MSLSRSRSPSVSVQVSIGVDAEAPPTSPSPPPTPISEECYRSSHAVFVKCWNRGENSCSRCDFEYLPNPNSRHGYLRENESMKSSDNNAKLVTGSCKPYDDKMMDIKKEEKFSPVLKKRPPPESFGSDAQIVSSLMSSSQPMSCDNAALRAYMMMHDPTPALRQLSEYARPHLGGKQDVLQLVGPTNQGLPAPDAMPFNHGDVSYIQRHHARERFEELERRTLAGCKDDMKSVRDWPAASAVAGLPVPLTPSAAACDLPLAELQHLYGPTFLPPVSGLDAVPLLLPQVWYQSPDLAAELLQQERLEQLAGSGAAHAMPGYHAAVDAAAAASRMPAAERLNIPSDPLLRLQLASAGLGPGFAGDSVAAPGVSAADMAHTHTHSHTHLHLHQPDSASAAAASIFPPLHPLFASQLLQSSALNLPVDPLAAAGNPPSGIHRSIAGYGSVPGMPLAPANPAAQALAAAQQQELLYRELLSRAPYVNDPALTQQLLAQAAVIQQEAARHIDRELGLKLPR